MLTPKPDAPVEERHRRMAAEWHHGRKPPTIVEHWAATGETDGLGIRLAKLLEGTAQLIATVERDAHAAGKAEGREEAAKRCEWLGRKANEDDEAPVEEVCRECAREIRRLAIEDAMFLPEPPRTGPELAAEHGFTKLAESGASRVPGVSEDTCKCGSYASWDPAEHPENPRCPIHGTKGGGK